MQDEGTGNAQSALSTQAQDQYGNATQSVIYPYNNASTALNTYNSTFLDDSTYASGTYNSFSPNANSIDNYIRNRPVSNTLTTGWTTHPHPFPCSGGTAGKLFSKLAGDHFPHPLVQCPGPAGIATGIDTRLNGIMEREHFRKRPALFPLSRWR